MHMMFKKKKKRDLKQTMTVGEHADSLKISG